MRDLMAEVAQLKDADQIMAVLDREAAPFNMQAYGFWRLPKRPNDYRNGYMLDQTVFIHPRCRPHYDVHIARARELGANVLARRSWISHEPFTITECMRDARPTPSERWVFKLLHEYGIRDGL
jgi:hypothetical protein